MNLSSALTSFQWMVTRPICQRDLINKASWQCALELKGSKALLDSTVPIDYDGKAGRIGMAYIHFTSLNIEPSKVNMNRFNLQQRVESIICGDHNI